MGLVFGHEAILALERANVAQTGVPAVGGLPGSHTSTEDGMRMP